MRGVNRATRIIASTLGVLLGMGGLDHGILEAMQGNTPTGGHLINALAAGTSWSLLKQGGEGAFTVVPNFLLTGILSIAMALAVIVWSAWFIHRRRGSLVLLLLCLFLVLVGGGIAQILFIAITLAVSTRIRSPARLVEADPAGRLPPRDCPGVAGHAGLCCRAVAGRHRGGGYRVRAGNDGCAGGSFGHMVHPWRRHPLDSRLRGFRICTRYRKERHRAGRIADHPRTGAGIAAFLTETCALFHN